MAEAEGRPSARAGRIAGLDMSVAHLARVYDYWLGGKDNFAADREAAERVLALRRAAVPGAALTAPSSAGRPGTWPARPGIRQFLDIGTGIPTGDNTHEVAQRGGPGPGWSTSTTTRSSCCTPRHCCRSTPQGATDYIQADLRDPGLILDRAAALLDFSQPVAVMLLGVLHLIQIPRIRGASWPG